MNRRGFFGLVASLVAYFVSDKEVEGKASGFVEKSTYPTDRLPFNHVLAEEEYEYKGIRVKEYIIERDDCWKVVIVRCPAEKLLIEDRPNPCCHTDFNFGKTKMRKYHPRGNSEFVAAKRAVLRQFDKYWLFGEGEQEARLRHEMYCATRVSEGW